MAGGSLGAESTKGTLGVGRVAGQGLVDFLVDDNVDLDAAFSCTLQDVIQTPILSGEWRSAQEEFGRQPPVLDVDCLLCSFKCDRHGVEVVAAINVPLDFVSISFRRETLEAMAFANFCSLLVGSLLVLFVVTMVWVDQVLPLANLVLCMDGFHLDVVEGCLLQLLSQVRERMLDVVASTLMLRVGRVTSLLCRRVDMRRLSDKTHVGVFRLVSA